jgi:hypothetical protein
MKPSTPHSKWFNPLGTAVASSAYATAVVIAMTSDWVHEAYRLFFFLEGGLAFLCL